MSNPSIPESQTQVEKVQDPYVVEKAREVLEVLSYVAECDVAPDFSEFKTLEDVVGVLVDVDGYNMYKSTCAPSVREFLRAVALMAGLCYHYDADLSALCEEFYRGLGMFIVTDDARAFLSLEELAGR